MKSDILNKDKQALIELCKSMSPQERLEAFYRHSRLVYGIYSQGLKLRRQSRSPKMPRS